MYSKAFKDHPESKGLYYLIDPKETALRNYVISLWRDTIGSDALEYIGPTLVPTEVLQKSGHLREFKQEIFKLEGGGLCLRPETAQSLFANLKAIRRQVRGKTLKIHQIGRAYRNQKSSRDSSLRKCEFEQLELHVIASKSYDFLGVYQEKIDAFFNGLGLSPSLVLVEDRPHYSERTIDFYIGETEVGCVNYRGDHDLSVFSEKEREDLNVYQISFGLDRLIHFSDTDLIYTQLKEKKL